MRNCYTRMWIITELCRSRGLLLIILRDEISWANMLCGDGSSGVLRTHLNENLCPTGRFCTDWACSLQLCTQLVADGDSESSPEAQYHHRRILLASVLSCWGAQTQRVVSPLNPE